MKTYLYPAALLILLILISSCTKELLQMPSTNISSTEINCEAGNNWCINKKNHFVPLDSKSKISISSEKVSLYWEDKNANSISMEVKELPNLGERIVYKAEQVLKLETVVKEKKFVIDPSKYPLKDDYLSITNSNNAYVISLQEIDMFDLNYFFINFRMCELKVLLQN